MRTCLVLVVLLTVLPISAQNYEVGVYLGGANYIGDIGPTTYVNPNSLAAGMVFKWNKSTRYSWRASIIRARIQGDDNKASIGSRKERGYVFDNRLTEFGVGLEVNYFKFNLHRMSSQFTPYLYTGVHYFMYDETYFDGNQQRKMGTDTSFAIPMVLGVKKTLGRFLVIGLEVGARYTFTDNLDGSNPKKTPGVLDVQFGNKFSDDWYVFTGLTLTYTFGRKPCYDCVGN
ncbi:MAG: DUF6089 family protein [Flavobacteriaceae bacterium]|nr:DUF6089 family protein [Flavobacteriaceae bacterium]